jgi:hypothetical protein
MIFLLCDKTPQCDISPDQHIPSRMLNGGDSGGSELLGVADIIQGSVRLQQTSRSSMGWWWSMFGECSS